MVESGYSDMLLKKSSSMIKEAYKADNLFVGGSELMLWSVSQKKVTKEYDDIMAGRNNSMVQTSDKGFLFVSDVGES